MGYYEPQEALVTVTQQWKLLVPSKRYFTTALREIEKAMKPTRTCLWKLGGQKLNGYQADLLSFSIDHALDSATEPSYPDW